MFLLLVADRPARLCHPARMLTPTPTPTQQHEGRARLVDMDLAIFGSLRQATMGSDRVLTDLWKTQTG